MIIDGREIESGTIELTPELAAQYLLREDQYNRKSSVVTIAKYARAMSEGKWLLTGAPIVFDTTGTLIDGAHRCRAVVKSGVTIVTAVRAGVPPEARGVIDDGRPRDDRTRYQMLYREAPLHHCFGIAQAMVHFGRSGGVHARLSFEEKYRLFERYKDAISFVCSSRPTHYKTISAVSVQAAIARAYYHCDNGRLLEFCRVLDAGVSLDARDSAAVLLGSRLLRDGIVGSAGVLRAFRQTENAIKHFMNGDHVTRLWPASAEIYPLPDGGDSESVA